MVMRKIGFLILISILLTNNVYAKYYKLIKKNYEGFKNEKAVVIYGANWGRHWGCGDMANAQLRNITFSRIDVVSKDANEELILKAPFSFSNKNIFESYVIIVDPGKYALTGFDIKMADLSQNVRHLEPDKDSLISNGDYVGGTFTVNAGEVVYIGHFGLDCLESPILWRYYIEKEDFKEYVTELKRKYTFLFDKEVVYRLFQTTKFGK